MDKEKEIEKMAKAIYETGVAIDGTDIAFGLIDDSHFERMARKLVAEGYGDVRAAVKEVLDKVYNAVENARLECEFQDEKGTWLMEEGEFMSEFTLGELHRLYAEYGIELFRNTEQVEENKNNE